MKRYVCLLLSVLFLINLIGCTRTISTTPLEKKEVDSIYYTYQQSGKIIIKVPHHKTRYKVYFRIDYDDGSVVYKWIEVSKEEYELVYIDTENQNG